jgi:hypothetical protein
MAVVMVIRPFPFSVSTCFCRHRARPACGPKHFSLRCYRGGFGGRRPGKPLKIALSQRKLKNSSAVIRACAMTACKVPRLEVAAMDWDRDFARGIGRMDKTTMTAGLPGYDEAGTLQRTNDLARR